MYERDQAFIEDRHRCDREQRTDIKKIIIYSLPADGIALHILHLLLCTEMIRYIVQERARFKIPGSLPKHRHC
jgi:hypothetical protein